MQAIPPYDRRVERAYGIRPLANLPKEALDSDLLFQEMDGPSLEQVTKGPPAKSDCMAQAQREV